MRGGFFRSNESSTWQSQGIYELHVEQDLGYQGNGAFGYETIALGVKGSGAPSIDHQIIAGIATKDIYLATWGIRPAPTNFSSLNDPIPSWITSLKYNGQIASISWAYTAGAYSQFAISKQGLASLTIGGYDESRFLAHNASFAFAADGERDLTVGLQNVSVGESQLLPTAALTFIDAGVSQMWLPLDACRVFEEQFHLVWNETLELYLINNTANAALLTQNLSISFKIANDLAPGSDSVTIDVPYNALVLNLTTEYPGNTDEIQYFPLRRAANSTQNTLGRAFLQYAYVIADYERFNFSVHQAVFPKTNTNQLQAILPPISETSSPSASSTPPASAGLPAGGIAGIVVGSVVAIALILGSLIYLHRRYIVRKCELEQARVAESKLGGSTSSPTEISGRQKSVFEMSYGPHQTAELHGKSTVLEVGTGWEGCELDRQQTISHEME